MLCAVVDVGAFAAVQAPNPTATGSRNVFEKDPRQSAYPRGSTHYWWKTIGMPLVRDMSTVKASISIAYLYSIF